MSEYRCAANDCPMFGAIANSGSSSYLCCYHHGVQAQDWPRVTQIIADWMCVAVEANRARCAMLQVDIPARALGEAWARLKPQIQGGWERELEPLRGDNYRDWGRRLETFLLARVKGELPVETPAVEEWA